MTRRVEELAGGFADVRRILGGTFHHAAHVLLRQHAGALGFSTRLHGAGPRGRARPDVLVHRRAQAARGERRFPKAGGGAGPGLHRPPTCSARSRRCWCERRPQFLPLADEVLARGAPLPAAQGAHAPDGLRRPAAAPQAAARGAPRVRAQLAERFRCVLVDEYQDTNRLQGDLVDLLAGERKNLTVVGDDCQSIYSFRGADFTNIIDFPAALPRLRRLPAHAQLPLHAGDPPARQRLHRAQPAPVPQGAHAPRGPRAPCPCVVPTRDVAEQAAFVAAAGARAARRGHAAGGDGGALPRAQPLAGAAAGAGPPRHPLPGALRACASSSRPTSRTCSRTCGCGQPARRARLQAGGEAGARRRPRRAPSPCGRRCSRCRRSCPWRRRWPTRDVRAAGAAQGRRRASRALCTPAGAAERAGVRRAPRGR